MKHLLKYIILFSVATFAFNNANAQVTIPDPNFKQFLIDNYPTVINGSGELDTIVSATISGTFACEGQNVSDVEGIQYFKNIQRLRLRGNNLATLPNLNKINTGLIEIRIDTNNLTTLPSLSKFTTLEILTCRENNLTSLPSFNGLTQLRQFFCDNNNLASLPDFTGLISLEHIICADNPLTSLPDFNDLVSLKRIICANTQITSFPNLSNCTILEDLLINNNNLTSLPDLSNCTALQDLHVHYNQLTTLPDLSNCTALQNLQCHYNQLTALPDLSNCTAIINLHCHHNQLTALPDLSNCTALQNLLCEYNQLSSLPYVNNCIDLRKLVFDHNQVNVFPDISALTNLRDICAQNNLLDTMPDLSAYLLLNTIKFYDDKLSFEDFMPSMDHPSFNIFQLNPQSPGTVRTINIFEKDNLEINLGFDDTVTTNTYQWYKDGIFIGSTSVNKFIINPVEMNNAGVYTCTITNSVPALAGITLSCEPITVVVAPCLIINNIDIQVLNDQCEYPITISVDENSIIGGTKPFTYTLKNTINNKESVFTSPLITTTQEGYFNLIIQDMNGCEATVQGRIAISRNEDCDPVFYPNGDGIADTYFVERKGLVKIYNRDGQMVKDFTGPDYWDGKTNNGEDAVPGMYAIIINDSETIRLYLIR